MLDTSLVNLIGIAGGFFILVAWLYETLESVKHHKALDDLGHAFIYTLGLIFLTIYSYILEQPVFFWLEVAILCVVVFEILYTLHFKIIKKKRRRKFLRI